MTRLFEDAYSASLTDGRLARKYVDDVLAGAVAMKLAIDGIWFVSIPMPDGLHGFAVKDEAAPLLAATVENAIWRDAIALKAPPR